jgi:3-oxoacyl-[acyl-carrier protein] reductase
LEPRVITVGRSAGRLPPASDRVLQCEADIGTAEGRDAIITSVERLAAPIRYVVIASGIAHRSTIEGATAEDWDRTLQTNLIGPALLIGRLLGLAWSDPAAIVIIGSLAARRVLPDRSLYGSVKAGLEQFARAAAVELAPRGISVNVISAGVVDTPFLSGDRDRLDRYAALRVPVRRMARPTEVADLVRYVITAPGFLTGAVIDLDGGAGVVG